MFTLSRFFACAIFSPLFCFSSLLVAQDGATKETQWKLVWHDEFSKKDIDQTKWSHCERRVSDWNNFMSDRKDLYIVKDGVLRLRGIVNDGRKTDPVPFLTAGLTTKKKFSFAFGKIEVSARFKSAKGAWPALWMLSASDKHGKYPKNGEIDLMEHLNYEKKIYQTIHSYYTLKQDGKGKPQHYTTTVIDPEAFNTYGMEWDKNKIVFTVNSKPTLTYTRDKSKGHFQFPFDEPFYLIMSMQIEGSWVGKADPKDYPAHMEVDWVRVWQARP